ncbi:unnamed protein product [Tilletia laevis]|uniref:RING-type E3 ubiquitin transferase n=1 Tax=Tilletia laevis TaxID=157183 RepID=A0A9N8LFK5_9BASI|nr:unnamed protein product [Tilletia laevis]
MKRSAEDMLSSDKTDRLSAEQATSSASSSSSSSTATAAAAALALHTMSGSAASSSSAALGPGPSFASTSTAPESSSSAQRRKLDAASTSASASSSSCGMDDQRHLAHTGSCKKIDDASSATAGAGMVSITATELHMDLDSPSDVEPPSELCSNPAAVAASAPMKEKEVRVEDAKAGPDAVAAAAKKDAQLELIIDELVCDICLELMVNPAALTPCQHVFCWSCAKVWMQDSSKCPTCATPITHAHLNHKLAKLAELAVSLAPADRIRPTVEIEAAKTRLEQHKALLGSSTIRAMARVEAEDPYRPDLTIYWPCLACRPGNRSGFQCTFRIPTPATGSPPARGAHWPLIEEADEDGLNRLSLHRMFGSVLSPIRPPRIVPSWF